LPSAVALLTKNWSKNGFLGPLDLRNTLILVPTRHAGRRLRGELARVAAEKGSAVLAGSIVTPEHLLPLPADAAPEPLVLALLAKRLLAQQKNLPALFPTFQTDWTFSFALGIATQLQDVRRQLVEAEKTADDLIPLVPDDEKERWSDIAKLEQGLLKDVRRLGMTDPLQARLDAARQAPSAPPTSRVISLFIPDLSGLATRTLKSLSKACEVELHILAPESEADRFDDWGRPLPDRWENESLPITESQIHIFDQASDETERLAALLTEADREQRALALCTPDPDQARALARRLQVDGSGLYLPNGVPLTSTAPGRLLAAWLTLRRQQTYAATAMFLRHPDAQDWISAKLELDDVTDLLSELDACQSKHLPTTFEDLYRFAKGDTHSVVLSHALEEVKTQWDTPLPLFLADLYDCRNPDSEATPDPLFSEAIQALASLIQSTGESAQYLQLGTEETLDLLLVSLPNEQVFPKPNPAAMRETLGWLEVQWDPTPALLLADVREGIIPETRIGDAFLPDSIRTQAGMAGNRDAFARDLYLTRALLASRPENSVHFLMSRRATNQDPQLPSRLLLACPDAELSNRVSLLFDRPALHAAGTSAPDRPRLELTPPACAPDQIPRKISVTAFRSYLACPFRYYLSTVLRMRATGDNAHEIDAMQFGNLAHDALFCLRNVPDLDNEDEIKRLLLAELDTLVKKQFGTRPPLALLVQLDSLRQRLGAAARIQAESVREGWRILSAEEKFEVNLEGMLLHGRIDRIDRHHDGRIRILDYKTTDSGKEPNQDHYRPHLKEWENLQLPLYRFIYETLHPEAAPVTVGYFNLPKGTAETKIAMMDFQPKDEDLYDSAIETAKEVVKNIQAGVFWPPSEMNPDWDDFSLLFTTKPPLIRKPRPDE